MKTNLLDLIDFEKVDTLLEGFNKSTGFVTAILDLEGNVLSKSGWRQMCTQFHRINPETAKMCTISDTVLANKMAEGEKYHFYKCLNGLVDVAVPLVIKGEHIANLFSGQFFFEEPDPEFFKKQAEKYGFDENEYLKSLRNVPAVSQEKVKTAMDFLLNMTQMISEMTFLKMELLELNNTLTEGKEHYRSILQTAMDGFWLVDPRGYIQEVNDTYCKMSGYAENELTTMHIQDLEVIETSKDISTKLQRLREQGETRFETQHHKKDGSVFDLEISVQYRPSKGGQYVVFLKDLTERKRTEQERQKFEMLAESSSEFIGMYDLELNPIYLNPAGMRMVGLPDMAAAYSVKGQDYFFPEDQQFIAEEFFPRVLHEGQGDVEIRLRHFQTGEPIWMYYYLFHLLDANGTVIGWATVSRDITERKQTEDMLHVSEEKYRQLYESNQMPISIFDAESLEFLSVNNAFAEKYGYTKEELLKMNILDIRPNNEIEKVKGSVKVIDKGLVNAGVFQHQKKNGQIMHVEIIRHDLVYEGRHAKLVFANDITDRIQAEENLKEKSDFINRIIDTSALSTWISDENGTAIQTNPACLKFFGATEAEVIGRYNLLKDEVLEKQGLMPEIRKVFEKGEVVSLIVNYDFGAVEHVAVKSATHKIINSIFTPIIDKNDKVTNVIVQAIDLTDRIQSEEKIQKQLEELKRYNSTMVDREIRMIQLKREINDYCSKLNLPPQYSIPEKTNQNMGGN